MKIKKSNLGGIVLFVCFLTAVLVACQKEAVSKANFIFKPAPNAETVAKIGDEVIVASEFEKGIESDLYDAEMKVYEIKFARLQAMLLEKFMNQDPQKKGLTNDQYLDQFIAKNIKITDQDVEKFIKDRQIPKEQLTPEIKARINEYLVMEGKKTAVDKWIMEKTKDHPVEIYLKKPALPFFDVKAGNAPFKGGKDAKVTIVEFSDFQCPFCSKGAQLVTELSKKYGDKIKIAFKNYPLPFHTQAKLAAEAGLCANEQSTVLFWKMHDIMFADQTKLDKESLIASAKKIGAKEADFKTCLESGKFKGQVESDLNEGQAIGVKSTPTFYVNGKLITGARPIEMFTEVIDEELVK